MVFANKGKVKAHAWTNKTQWFSLLKIQQQLLLLLLLIIKMIIRVRALCLVEFGVNCDGGGWRAGGPALKLTIDSIHDHPGKTHPFIALHAIYTAYLRRSLCLSDALCQPLFSGFFTTDSALWILTVWSLLPHKQLLGTPYHCTPTPLHSAAGLWPQLSVSRLLRVSHETS